MAKPNPNNKMNRNDRNRNTKFAGKGDRKQGRQKGQFGDPFTGEYTKENSTKGERRAVEVADSAYQLSKSNPVAFYTKFSKFARDAANVQFATVLGNEIEVAPVEFADVPHKWYVPGLMRIRFTPTIGISNDFSSPINRASNRFYTYLRSNQKASGDYDHQDVTMMEISMDSCYMFHALCSRLYKLVRDFTPVNLYYPRALVSASGGIYDDIKENLQDFRAYINQYAYNLGQYALPKDMTLFDRHRWMCEGIYVDSSSSKAQTYMFVPDGFWKYDNTVETGSQCTWVPYLTQGASSGQHTVAQLMEIGDALLNAVSNDSDFATISGDIYNFFGGDTYKLPYLNENDQIAPSYDEIVLSQIENLSLVGPLDLTSLVISQNPNVNQGAILFQPTLSVTYGNVSQGWHSIPMNFHKDDVTPDDIIEATRLMAVLEPVQKLGDLPQISACGTELITTLDVFTRNPATGAFRSNPIYHTLNQAASTDTPTVEVSHVRDILHLAQFDWAPLTAWYYASTSPSEDEFIGWSWDVDNWAYMPNTYLKNIHLAALYSLFEAGNNREGSDVVSE